MAANQLSENPMSVASHTKEQETVTAVINIKLLAGCASKGIQVADAVLYPCLGHLGSQLPS